MKSYTLLAAALIVVGACDIDDETDRPEPTRSEESARAEPGVATALASGRAELSLDELERGRLDPSWRRFAEGDSAGADRVTGNGSDTTNADPADGASSESWEDITGDAVNAEPRGLPIQADMAGPSVAKVQILLDQVGFSPGIIDGRWGKNTEKAVYWFQRSNGLDATGEVDRRTLQALTQRGEARQVIRHQVTAGDVSGPFQDVPDDIYEQAELSCLCYQSKREQLAEVFHTSPEILEQLNPGVDLSTVEPGASLDVPAVEPFRMDNLPDGQHTGGNEVARIVISDGGHYLHAMDQAGSILYHFPSTLGADYSPSPTGEFTVESITFDPSWHYQPDILTGVDPDEEDAVVPGGPNNAVGIVWMALSKPHYGIHGTAAPETIGYVTSNGCVRLTNWDAAFLGQRIPPGVPVEFRDVDGRDA